MNGFSSIVHILGRHPELASNEYFQAWFAKYGGGLWHETQRTVDGFRTVVVQSLDRLRIFAAQVNSPAGSVPNQRNPQLIAGADFDLVKMGIHWYSAVVAVALERNVGSQEIQAVRPVIDFSIEPPQLCWEVEVVTTEAVETYQVDLNHQIVDLHKRTFQLDGCYPPAARRVARLTNDWLAANELHHPDRFVTEALQWAEGATAATEKASRILQNVADSYSFDSTINRIKEFTFADILIRDRLGRKGVCDEFAVVMTTYLRALGIPTAIKLLNFQTVEVVGHACVELFDGHKWVHADPLYGLFDNRAFYRTEILARNVLVMDADYPRDDRSDVPAFGLPDPEGDLQLNPYTDFILYPSYPGNQRPGYSY